MFSWDTLHHRRPPTAESWCPSQVTLNVLRRMRFWLAESKPEENNHPSAALSPGEPSCWLPFASVACKEDIFSVV